MSRRSALAGLVLAVLPVAGCLATKPYVRTQVQQGEARTQQQLQAVERRLDTVEQGLAEVKTQHASLDADVHQVRGVAEDAAKQASQARELATQTRDLAVKADDAARDALQAVNGASASKAPEPVAAAPEIFVVHFGYAEWWLDNSGRMTLSKALRRLQQNPTLQARLDGYSDSTGSASLNLKLSQRRADEVWRWLVAKGVKRSRIETRAIGEAQPVASNRNPAGRDQNRRVAITLLTAGQ
ncbi:MAG TPA: OmpA family protein [Methylomirabilota bacterium]